MTLRKTMLTLAIVLFVVATTNAQFKSTWEFASDFPTVEAFPDTFQVVTNTGVQFTAVDPDGRIWVAPYRTNNDSVNTDSGYVQVNSVYCFNPDGSQASFSPIQGVTVDGVFYPFTSTGYGIETDHNGNILYNNASVLYRINYQTGEGMNRRAFESSLAKVDADAAGNIYLQYVLPGYPLKVLYEDFSDKENAVDELPEYARTLSVSPDGNTIYAPRFSEGRCRVYQRADEFSPYELVDSMFMPGMKIESTGWNDVTGVLYFSTGSYQAPPADGWPKNLWVGINPETNKMVDYVQWKMNYPENANERARGISFSADGNTAYVGAFGASDYCPVQKFERGLVGLQEDENPVFTATEYNLEQNFPNPFNPSTTIKFSVPADGFVTLKVYDILGSEVMTLVDQDLRAGSYSYTFDGANLASGMYIYALTGNNVRITKKMMLLK